MSSVKPPAGQDPLRGYPPLPPELTTCPRWVLWRREPDAKGRPTKVLYNARTGARASTTNPDTWTAYPEAAAALARRRGFEGLGFVFSATDDLIGVDLDHCLDSDGAVAPWAQVIVERLASYTERSPSNTGLHIFVRGALPPGRRKREFGKPHADGRKSAVEMYEHGRYFTVTGCHLPGTPTTLTACSPAIAQIHGEFLTDGRKPSSDCGLRIADCGLARRPAPPPQSAIENPKSAIELLCQSPRFHRLWQGDWADYGSQSEADLALCARLAQLTRGDLAQIDRLFRQSGLYRAKWDQARGSQTYGQRTIARAIQFRISDCGFRIEGVAEREASPPKSENGSSFQSEIENPKSEIHLTDLGNAVRLVRRHGADLRHVAAWGCWLFWDGRRWCRDETGEAMRRAKETIRAMYADAAALPDGERQALARWAVKSEARPRLEAMLVLAESEPEVALRPQAFDADPWLFNCHNGTLELRPPAHPPAMGTRVPGTLREHRRSDLITKLAPVDYDPAARHERWDRFLAETTGGRPELHDFLRRAVGSSLTGDTRDEKLFFGLGPTNTGKSTFLGAIKAALGDYAETADFETFLARREVGGPRPDLARLAGARFVVSLETDEGRRLAEGLVKQMTGGDDLVARFLYGREFAFRPQFKLWLAANDAPKVRHEDDALWRRIVRVPFDQVVPQERRDPAIKAALHDPRQCGAAILAWLVRGCREWQAHGLGVPPVVLAATEAYREAMDPLKEFLDARCVIDPNARAAARAVWQAYQDWARENHVRHPLTQKALGERLRKLGSESYHTRDGNGWRGIGLITEAPLDIG